MTEATNPPNELTDKQQRFCEEYVLDWNATRSYLAAYPDSSYDAARSSASALLTNPNILAYINELKEKTAELAGVSMLRNAKELAKIAYTSAGQLRSDWRDVKEWEDLTEEEKAILSEITYTKRFLSSTAKSESEDVIVEERVHYKTYDKQKAIELLNRMFGWNAPDKSESKIKITEEKSDLSKLTNQEKQTLLALLDKANADANAE